MQGLPLSTLFAQAGGLEAVGSTVANIIIIVIICYVAAFRRM